VLNVGPLPSVARIIVPEKDGVSYGSGTLVAVREQNGLIITNWHVVRDAAGPISVLFPDSFQSPAQVLKVDQDWDLAALAIWKPQAAPQPVSAQAPQPGEDLIIAGYGSGQWRAAAGKCTQYVSPSNNHPLEMVEVSASARQGDSGGPILNARGELAGVLFGSAQGATSGSYCGRVREFLTSLAPEMAVAPPAPNPQPLVAATPPAMPGWPGSKPPANAIPVASTAPPTTSPPVSKADPYGPPIAPEPPPAEENALASTGDQGHAQPTTLAVPPKSTSDRPFTNVAISQRMDLSGDLAPRTRELEPIVERDEVENSAGYMYTPLPPRGGRSLSGSLDSAEPKELLAALWTSLVGASRLEQGKSLLALLGLAAVFFRLFGSRRSHDGGDDVDD
jgi:hypothetical protein